MLYQVECITRSEDDCMVVEANDEDDAWEVFLKQTELSGRVESFCITRMDKS